jgi:hypothetical protein
MLPDLATQERMARNDATFRFANERMRHVAEQFGMDEQVPFFCECADPTCQELIQLSLADYSSIRSDPRHFLNAPHHEHAAHGSAVVVETHGRYNVVEKVGFAGEIAERLDHQPPPE